MQNKKNSKDPRVNFYNTRDSKFVKDLEGFVPKDFKPKKKRGQRGKNFKPNAGGPQKTDKFEKKFSNHDSWYMKNPLLVEQSGRWNFNIPVGAPDTFNLSAPGVMAMYYSPSYGGKSIQVLNTLKESLYSFVVHANSRNYSYSPNDLLLMIMAVIECFEIVTELKRAYGIMRKWSAVDEYTPRILLEAMGFNYDDLRSHYATMAQDINLIIADLRNLWIPNTFPILDRTLWLAENVFIDTDSAKAQMYCFVRNMHLTYDQTLNSSGGMLVDYNFRKIASFTNDTGSSWGPTTYPADGTGRVMPWITWVETATIMISRLVRMQDRGMICGDIKKAYGESGIFVMPYMDETFEVIPIYDEEALMSIHNASISPIQIGGLMQQAAASLQPVYFKNKFTPGFTEGATTMMSFMDAVNGFLPPANDVTRDLSNIHPATPILNTSKNTQPDPIEVFKYTRFTLAYDDVPTELTMCSVNNRATETATLTFDTTKSKVILPYSTGSEVINTVCVFTKTNPMSDGDDNQYYRRDVIRSNVQVMYDGYKGGTTAPTTSVAQDILVATAYQYRVLRDLFAFDWAPIIYMYVKPEYNAADYAAALEKRKNGVYLPILDYNNYTTATASDLRNLNRVVLFSLYDVPVL